MSSIVPGVFIACDPGDPVASSTPAQWSIEQLRTALSARGIAAAVGQRPEQAPAGAMCIVAAGAATPTAREALGRAGVSMPDVPESLGLVPAELAGRPVLLACGTDARGLVYALLELADRVEYAALPRGEGILPLRVAGVPAAIRGRDAHDTKSEAKMASGRKGGTPAPRLPDHVGAALDVREAMVERPANEIRSIMRLFASEVEDKGWYHDRTFWPPYLSMLAAQRFNRFALALGLGYDFTSHLRDTYFHFAYPFLVSVPGYDVRVPQLPDEERDRNLQMLRFISDEAARRGLHFQLGLWTHAYRWTDSPDVNYTIEGLTPETHAAYCRAALEILLRACPSIGGVTFRVHGESGVAEGSYEFWKTVFAGVVRCGRRIEIDMHAKGMDQPMIDLALATGLPVNISPKYWAEHMGLPYHQAAIRPTELPPPGRKDEGFFSRSSGSRRFLRYGYGDLLAENRRYGVLHRMWPGTQRLLLWGDPVLAAGYGRSSSFCGSKGAELFEPLSFKGRKGSGLPGGRAACADASLSPVRDYEKYLYGYRLWGRLLYNPEAQPETWRRFLRQEYGPAAEGCEAALAHASRILPLFTTAHTPSAANNNYWPEIYTNMPMVDAKRPHPYGDTPSPKRFGTVSPLDARLFATVDAYAGALIQGTSGGYYSPVEVAKWLEELAERALSHLGQAEARIADRDAPAFRRLAVDVAIQSGLGRFFAAKLRGGVLYAIYDRTGLPAAREAALQAYRTARTAWADLAAQAEGVYVDDITFGLEKQLRGHWRDRLAAIDADITDMEKHVPAQPAAGVCSEAALRFILSPGGHTVNERPVVRVSHTPPLPFRPGQPVTVELTLHERQSRIDRVCLSYRHVHQAQSYRTVFMAMDRDCCSATIPGEYTDTPYPLMYYFDLRDEAGRALLYPGFDANRANQPYFAVRQA